MLYMFVSVVVKRGVLYSTRTVVVVGWSKVRQTGPAGSRHLVGFIASLSYGGFTSFDTDIRRGGSVQRYI